MKPRYLRLDLQNILDNGHSNHKTDMINPRDKLRSSYTMCEQMEASLEAHRPYGSETSVDQRFLAMLGTLQEEPA